MSAYSTLRVTRSHAKLMLMTYLLGQISDRMLERFMDSLLDHRLYNCVIVPDCDPDNDDEEAYI